MPGKLILVVNAGSSSLKYAIYMLCADQTLMLVAYGCFEYEPSGAVLRWLHKAGPADAKERPVASLDRASSLNALFELVGEVDAVVHRIVMGRGKHLRPFVIDTEAMIELEKLIPLAPLHQPHNLRPVRILKELRPTLLQIGSPDNGFHRTIRGYRKRLAVSAKWHHRGVMKHGWHGHSFEFVAKRAIDIVPKAKRIVIAHLGSGASLCAVKDGRSVDTTMTFTPLAGLPGSTRSGSLDAAAVLFMIRELRKERAAASLDALVKEVETDLWKRSGLLGIGGEEGDMRKLLASKNRKAKLAVNVFCLSVAQQIAMMYATLGGIDALVFTGGIGERSPIVRKKILGHVRGLGLELDAAANNANALSIGLTPNKILVIRTNEELVMARAAVSFFEQDTARSAA